MTFEYNGALVSDGYQKCARCDGPINAEAKPMKTKSGEFYHSQCLVCVQCFKPFRNNSFFEYDGRKYCQEDFYKLYSPSCYHCKQPIIGKVIKALHSCWHPKCFICEECKTALGDIGFVKLRGKPHCHDCNRRIKDNNMAQQMSCFKCHGLIDEKSKLKFQSEFYHAYHFNCSHCASELTSDAREKDGELFCIRCFDKIGMPICGACRRPIEERVIHALGKTWHVDHFVCARCEKPFLGTRHYEKRGLAYCELHYQELFGSLCFVCSRTISNDMVTALSKNWCLDHFTCSMCDGLMDPDRKFHELDMKPVCNGCYDLLPTEFRKRMAKLHKES